LHDFEEAVAAVLRDEGGYVNDPNDAGGETKYGISKRSYPSLDIADLTAEDAEEIYRRDWWVKYQYELLPWPFSAKAFDIGVNIGGKASIMLLQHALWDMNDSPGDATIDDDGVLGGRTLALVHLAPPSALYAAYIKAIEAHYYDIVERNPRNEKYLAGWLRRAEETFV